MLMIVQSQTAKQERMIEKQIINLQNTSETQNIFFYFLDSTFLLSQIVGIANNIRSDG